MTAEQAKKYRIRGRFITMIVVSLAIILIFASLLFIISTAIYTKNAAEQLDERFNAQISAISDTLSLQFENARSHGNILFNERSTILYFHPQYEITEYEKSYLNQVMAEIARSENMLIPYIISECLFFTDDDYVLTSGGSYDKDLYFSRIIKYEKYDESFWNSLSAGIQNILPITEAKTTQSASESIIPIVTTRRKDGSTLVHIANIDARYIKSIISSGNLEFSYALTSLDGDTIIASDDFEIEEASSAALSYTTPLVDSALMFNAYISTSSQYGMMARLILSNVIIIITLCSIGSLLIIMLSKRLYNPIRTIRELIPESGHTGSEIEEITNSVSTLITRNDQLAAESVSRQMLLYFSGIAISEEKLAQDMREFSLDGTTAAIAVLTISRNKDKSKAAAAIINELRSQDTSILITLDENLHEIMLKIDNEQKEVLSYHVKRALDASSVTALVGISIVKATDPGELRRAHKEAMQAIPVNTGQTRSEIRFFGDMGKANRVSFSFYDQRGIGNNFSSGNRKQLEEFTRTIIERNIAREINTATICEILQQILFIGRNEMEKRGHSYEEVPLYLNFTRALSESHDRSQLPLLVDQSIALLSEMQALSYPYEDNSKNPKIAEAKTFINENYMKPISLDIMADSLAMNPKYLSQLFKSETGKNISDYIAELRIEKAKELLIGTDLKIGEIADAIGIPSRATFLRVFQKIENITPTEFRNIRKKEK